MTVAVAPSRGAHGRWTCNGCGRTAPWSDGWMWLGRYHLTRGMVGEVPIIEKVLCPACAPTDVKALDS